jgi:hypothetical protein
MIMNTRKGEATLLILPRYIKCEHHPSSSAVLVNFLVLQFALNGAWDWFASCISMCRRQGFFF